ncbi:MAG: guanylate kinase [Muribaculaceae bacterium]|nr:guanylate kinase [Muribaculaceae bacterium]
MCHQGKLIIISAPSGSGKSTIIGRIMQDESLRLSFSVSATTRPRRGEEVNGVDYYYKTVDEFKQMIADDQLVEYQEVYEGRYYGTPKSEVERITGLGRNVVLDLDVLGGVNVKRMYGDRALSIFIQPPSVEVLRQRLIGRGTDSMEDIMARVSKAEFEISIGPQFDYTVINDDLETAVAEVHRLISDFVTQG